MWRLTRSLWPILILVLASCASSLPRSLENVATGMDKDRVLQIAGNPGRTFRENMHDHWVYIYFVRGQELHRDIVFTDGLVTRVGRPLTKDNWVKDLENADSMEEFEQKARAHQKKSSDNFKSVDGEAD